MKDVVERVAALEAENRDLKARLDALQVPAPTKVMPLPPSPVRVSHPMAKIELPTENEFEHLLAIVLDRFPDPEAARQFT